MALIRQLRSEVSCFISPCVGLHTSQAAQVAHKEDEMARMRAKHDEEHEQMQILIEDATHRADLQGSQHEEAVLAVQLEYEALQQRMVDEVRVLKEKHRKIEQTVPQLEQEINSTKEQFRNLTISEGTYRDLITIPEERMSVRDFVRVRVYEELQTSHKTIKELQEKLTKAKEVEQRAESDATRAKRHADAVDREADSRDSSAQGEITVLVTQRNALQAELTKTRLEYEEGKSKMAAAEGATVRFEGLQKRLDEACSELIITKATLMELQDEKRERHADHLERQKQVELLHKDKAYLEKEVDRLRERTSELEETVAKKRAKMTELKKARDEMIDRLQRYDEDRRERAEDAVSKELAEIKAKAEHEREAIRMSLKELYEKEADALRDSRDSAVAETERANHKLNAEKVTHEQLRVAHRDMESKLSNQVEPNPKPNPNP